VLDDAAWLGVERDAAANEAGGPLLTTATSRVAAFAVPTNEELMIATHTRNVIRSR
jgi:acetate kinase